MKHVLSGSKRGSFQLLARSRNVQVAKMTLAPEATSDDSAANEHPASEQWLFVISGSVL